MVAKIAAGYRIISVDDVVRVPSNLNRLKIAHYAVGCIYLIHANCISSSVLGHNKAKTKQGFSVKNVEEEKTPELGKVNCPNN